VAAGLDQPGIPPPLPRRRPDQCLHDLRHFVATASSHPASTYARLGSAGPLLASTTLNVYAVRSRRRPPRRPRHQPTSPQLPTLRQRQSRRHHRARDRRRSWFVRTHPAARRPASIQRAKWPRAQPVRHSAVSCGSPRLPARRADRTVMGPLAPAPPGRVSPDQVRGQNRFTQPTGHFEVTRRVRL
jgi:hypothetical protein